MRGNSRLFNSQSRSRSRFWWRPRCTSSPISSPEWLGFAAGWALTFLLGRWAAPRFGTFLSSSEAVRRELPVVAIYGWLVGTAIAVVLSVGLLGAGGVDFAVAFFCALALMASGVCVAFVGIFVRRAADAATGAVFGVPVAGTTVLVVVAALRQFLLAPGIG